MAKVRDSVSSRSGVQFLASPRRMPNHHAPNRMASREVARYDPPNVVMPNTGEPNEYSPRPVHNSPRLWQPAPSQMSFREVALYDRQNDWMPNNAEPNEYAQRNVQNPPMMRHSAPNHVVSRYAEAYDPRNVISPNSSEPAYIARHPHPAPDQRDYNDPAQHYTTSPMNGPSHLNTVGNNGYGNHLDPYHYDTTHRVTQRRRQTSSVELYYSIWERRSNPMRDLPYSSSWDAVDPYNLPPFTFDHLLQLSREHRKKFTNYFVALSLSDSFSYRMECWLSETK
ncbi:hypothetical protein B9Z55_024803 [Caenorhabditis nigoni]|uniref:Uncharacterized protein n=1 Tax=Caenorhabditis nigoni TaxID=1611254 RepID=A0A2G5SW70_9PELO|nr:hypothetical protein B9Z55_024803 [Caenorhabditis nigoni]